MAARRTARGRRWRVAALSAALAGAAALGGPAALGVLAAPPGAGPGNAQPASPGALTQIAQAAAPERREPPVIEEPKADTQRPPVQIAVPQTGPGPVIPIPLADGLPGSKPAPGELPPAWALKRFAGRAQFELARDDNRIAFRLVSQASSFALHREVAIDAQQFPVLTWSWKVVRLPRGDARDQAAQVYVIFPRSPNPRSASEVLGYVWDTQAPIGHRALNPDWPNVRTIVVESGAERAGTWVREARNVRQDYTALFGKEPPGVGRIAVMTDSDHSRSTSEAFFSDLAFQRAEAASTPQQIRRN